MLEIDNGKRKADHANEGFFYKSWFNNGVKYITDLMDSNGNFIKYEEFVEETGVQSNFIQFTGVIACITKFMKENRVKIEKKQGPIFPSLIDVIQKQKKGSQNIYLILIKTMISLQVKLNGIKYMKYQIIHRDISINHHIS